MRVETRKTLVLTKEERRAIKELYSILNDDNDLTLSDCWEILQSIALDEDALDYNYNIDIVD